MKFIRFLERTGRVETPGDLDDNICILDGFLEQLRSDGYAPGTIDLHREGCAGLIVWLHLSRIRLCDLTPDVYARFRNRQFICSIPGVFCGRRMRSPGGTYETKIRKFLRYLVAIEQIESFESASEEKVLPEHLERFSVWLERNRDISPGSIRGHIRLIATALPALGDDPRAYDAALIRQVLFEAIEHRSRNCARKLTIAMRMYLRFLVSEGSIAAALIAAVPTVPRWRLSTLPRYIPADDVERTLDSLSGPQLEGIRILGKGRRDRELPLWKETKAVLNEWLDVRPPVNNRYLFLNARGRVMSPDGFAYILSQHVARAMLAVPSLKTKRVTPHVIRHSTAMTILHATGDIRKVSLWLGHADLKTTEGYLRASPAEKLEILVANAPPSIRPGAFPGAKDSLMSLLGGK